MAESQQGIAHKTEVEDGPRMTSLRQTMDTVIEKMIQKLDKKAFLSNMPKELDQEYLSSLHARLSSLLRPKMSALLEEKLEDFDLVSKLNDLDGVISSTQRSTSHVSWRPPALDTVNQATAAHDLQVTMAEKEELLAVLRQVEVDVAGLEEEVKDASRRVGGNIAEMTKRSQDTGELADKLTNGAL